MSVQWLKNKFTFADMAPEDMILSRHVEVLRAYDPTTQVPAAVGPTIPDVIGSADRIYYSPLGVALESVKLPAIFCSAGNVTVNPRPGMKGHVLTVRDVIRFDQLKPSDISEVWTPGLSSLVHLIRRAVDSNPHLTFTPTNAQVPGYTGEPIGLANHVDFRTVEFQNLINADGSLSTMWDCVVEFEYRLDVSKTTGRIWDLSVNEI